MKMRELVANSGVPRTAIHYYQREKLLPTAVKTAPNSASYSQVHLDRLALLTQLRERGLGIDQIRNILRWAADGADPQVAAALELAMSGGATGDQRFNLNDLAVGSGVPPETLRKFHKQGHLGSEQNRADFDGFDREAAQCLGQLLNLGVDIKKIEATAANIDRIVATDMAESFRQAADMDPAERARYFLNITENMDKLTRYFVLRSRQKNATKLNREVAQMDNKDTS